MVVDKLVGNTENVVGAVECHSKKNSAELDVNRHPAFSPLGLMVAVLISIFLALTISQLAFAQSSGPYSGTTLSQSFTTATEATTGELTPWDGAADAVGDSTFIGVEWNESIGGTFGAGGGISFGPNMDTSGQVGISALGAVNPAGEIAASYAAEIETTAVLSGMTSDGRRLYSIRSDEVDGTAFLEVSSSKLKFDLNTSIVHELSTSTSVEATFKPSVHIPKKTIDPNDYIGWPGWLKDLGVGEPGFEPFTVPGTNVSYNNAPSVSVSSGNQTIFDQSYSASMIDIDNGEINFPDSSVDVLAAALGAPGGVSANSDGQFHLDIRVPTVVGAAITTVVGAATGGVDNVFGDFSLGELEFYTASGNLEVSVGLSSSTRSANNARSDYIIGIAQDLDGIVALRTQQPAEKQITTPALPSVTIPKLKATASWSKDSVSYLCPKLTDPFKTCSWSGYPGSVEVTIFSETTIPGPGSLSLTSQAYDIDLLQTFDVEQQVRGSVSTAVTYQFNQVVTAIVNGVEIQGPTVTVPIGKEFQVLTAESSPAGSFGFTTSVFVDFDLDKDVALKFRDVGMNLGGPEMSFNGQQLFSVGTASFDLYTADSTLVSSSYNHLESNVEGSGAAAIEILDRLPYVWNQSNSSAASYLSGFTGGVFADFSNTSVSFTSDFLQGQFVDYYEPAKAEVATLLAELLGPRADTALANLQDYMAFGGVDGRVQLWNLGFDVNLGDDQAQLTFNYDDAGMLPNEERVLSIFHFDDANQWVRLDGEIDTDANTITVASNSFSPFMLGQVGPILTIPEDIVVEGNVFGGAALGTTAISQFLAAGTALDESDNAVEVVLSELPAIFPVGGTVAIEFTATSSGKSISDSASIQVVDTTPPFVQIGSIELASEQIEGSPIPDERGLISSWLASVAVVDLVDPFPLVSHDAPSYLSLGNNAIEFSAVDSSGNISTTIVDLTLVNNPPELDIPEDVLVEGNVIAGATLLHPDIQQFLLAATAEDPEDGTLSVSSTELPEHLPLNQTFNVTFSATDLTGWESEQSATITIVDTTPPVIELEGTSMVAEGPTGTQVPDAAGLVSAWVNTLLVTDIVDAEPKVSFELADIYYLGLNSTTFSAIDASGNESSTDIMLEVKAPFVLHAENSILIGKETIIESGMVVVSHATSPPWLSKEAQIEVEGKSELELSAPLYSDSVYVDKKAIVRAAYTNEFTGRGSVLDQSTYMGNLFFPLDGMPALAVGTESLKVSCGKSDKDDDKSKKSKKSKKFVSVTCLANGVELTSGDYGSLELSNGKSNNPTVLRLSGGTYTFDSIDLGKNTQLIAGAPTTLLVRNGFGSGKDSEIIGSAFGPLGETGLLILVGGSDAISGSGGDDSKSKKSGKSKKNDRLKIKRSAVELGDNGRVVANIYAAHGSIEVGHGSDIVGSLKGINIDIKKDSRLSFAPGF